MNETDRNLERDPRYLPPKVILVGAVFLALALVWVARTWLPPANASLFNEMLDQKRNTELLALMNSDLREQPDAFAFFGYRAVALSRANENAAARNDIATSVALRFSLPTKHGRKELPGKNTDCAGQVDQLLLPARFKDELVSNVCGGQQQ